MDVTCPACAARYTADEQKLRGKTARMRCRACDTVWLVSGPEDKMSDAKRAAVVKRGGERDHRDMFASRPADMGSVKQTLRPPPPAELCGVAARNESSVLFTVDALRGAARVKTPEPEPVPLSSAFCAQDDEGVIDLNALASSPAKVGARSVGPLFVSDVPPAAFAADVSDSGARYAIGGSTGFKLGKRAYAGIAAAAVAVVLCSVGLAAAFKGEEPVARTNAIAAPVSAPALAAAVVTALPAPQVIASAAPTTASSEEDTKEAPLSGKKGKKKGKGKGSFAGTKVQSGGVASFSKSKTTSSDALVSKPAVKPAADKCRCKGDFNCILRCTAKGS